MYDPRCVVCVCVVQRFYETKQYKKALKAAETILKKYTNHGGQPHNTTHTHTAHSVHTHTLHRLCLLLMLLLLCRVFV
jgi:hypothetical protein